MFVKKFEGDSLDEVLKSVKMELGPDAVILKTKTNKNRLSPISKKKKIEITAAVTKREYEKKTNVDNAIVSRKEDFYKAPASHIKKMITNYDHHNKNSSYQDMGLNKQANQNTLQSPLIGQQDDLDRFLNKKQESSSETFAEPKKAEINNIQDHAQSAYFENDLIETKQKIQELENKISSISHVLADKNYSIPRPLQEIRSYLLTHNIHENLIQTILSKIQFELSNEDQENHEIVKDIAIRELNDQIFTKTAQFSKSKQNATITASLSPGNTGQTSMLLKMAKMSLKSKCLVILELGDKKSYYNIKSQFLEIPIFTCKTIPELINFCNKRNEEFSNIFIDIKIHDLDLLKQNDLIFNLKKSFNNIEILLSLSALHSEEINLKAINSYRKICQGTIFSHLDLCLNFGGIVNCHTLSPDLPLVFFGTGEVIPNDIEEATSERLLTKIFPVE